MFTLYLKSIEIQGFKSFPTQTKLTFDKPVTAIVGPNGSGKSNISDAVLWVMGEQSTKMLRSGKMEDVIFGGTLRRPQQNYAEVSLIFDNSDGCLNLDTTEVMLTRRYYRAGESEFYINQSLVRLKEITELLMDTGLGREGYSVIGQGRISEILSLKSKDRRDIFEEAAGISRFRHKKDEAERKLQYTEENLVRIGDRISELDLQVGPLREQAEIAKKYNLLKGEQRGVEISLWLRDLETVAARTEKAESDHLAAIRDMDAAKIEYDEVFEKSEALSEMTAKGDIDAQEMRDTISGTEREKSAVDSNIAVFLSQLEGNTSQIENLKKGLDSHEEQHDGVGVQISDSEKRLEEISNQKSEKDERIEMLDKELRDIIDSSDRSILKHKELISGEQQMQSDYSEKRAELSALAAGAQELYDLEESYKQKLADSKADLNTLEEEQKRGNAELQKAREQVTSLDNILKGLALKVDSRTKKAEASGENLSRLSSEYETLKSRQTLLADMEKEFQGYAKSVKTVMQEHSRGVLKNIHGTVGSLVKTDDTYTLSIETALGGALQNIIVDTEEDGKAAVNLLKRRDAGRATFQPISTVKGNALDESEFQKDDGFVGLACNLVRYDKKYTGIYTYLLGRVVVCESLTDAINIARRHNHRYKIVTLDGQVMNSGGSMTGGSSAGGTGMLSRANELARLATRIEACGNELEKVQREHAELVREKTAAEYERDTAADELRIAREDVKMKELEQTHCEQNLNTAKEAIAALLSDVSTLENRMKQNSVDTDSLKNKISELETELTKIKAEIDEAIIGNEQLQTERERTTAGRSELRAEIAALDAEKESISKALTQLRNLREEMSGSRQLQLDTINSLEADNTQIRAQILEKQREAQELDLKIGAQKERLSAIDSGKLEVEAKRNEINNEIKAITDKYNDKQRKVSALEIKLEGIKGEETLILDRLWSTYELSRSAAVNHGTPIDNVGNAKKRLNVIKRELDDLGVPNLGAIKEYERVSERYEDYTTQRDDVNKAKEDLIKIIEEVTSRMKEIFVREFDIINESFKETFKRLFRGGQASLILEDPEDVLGCGIEIQVQPPGKSLKTITLLSGGEKAFVAIAIYFAILSVRPPPFVVMDEIDAALDDANVVRFSEYMRYMSENTQMIVITHKRGTMEEADVLYGITMQELGVSNILSIDLSEAEKHIVSKANN